MMKNLLLCMFTVAGLLIINPVEGRAKNPESGINFSQGQDQILWDNASSKILAQNPGLLMRPREKQNASLIKAGKYICPNQPKDSVSHFKNVPVTIKKGNERKNSWTVIFPVYDGDVIDKNDAQIFDCFQSGNYLICPDEDMKKYYSESMGAIVIVQENDSTIQIDPDYATRYYGGGSSRSTTVIPEGICKRK